MDLDKLAQRIVRPAVEAIRLEWHGWHGFRRGIASNLYELGANEKSAAHSASCKAARHQRSYIKAFDPAVLAATKRLETTLDTLNQGSANVQQVN